MFPVYRPVNMAGLRARYAALGAHHWEDGRDHAFPQDYADMLGWCELADKIWVAYQSLFPVVRAHILVHCDNYGEASAITFIIVTGRYSWPTASTLVLSIGIRLGWRTKSSLSSTGRPTMRS